MFVFLVFNFFFIVLGDAQEIENHRIGALHDFSNFMDDIKVTPCPQVCPSLGNLSTIPISIANLHQHAIKTKKDILKKIATPMNRQTRLILDTQKNHLQAANHTEHKLTHLYHSLQLIKSVCANQYTGMQSSLSQMVMDIVSEVKKYGAKVNLEAKLRNASRTAYQQTLVRILLTHDPDTYSVDQTKESSTNREAVQLVRKIIRAVALKKVLL